VCLGVVLVTTKPADWGRTAWTRSDYFHVQVPSVPRNEPSVVVLAGPCLQLGAVLPFFPEQTRFLGYTWHFSPRCDAEIEKIVAGHPGGIYVLSRDMASLLTVRDLQRLGLKIEPGSVRTLSTDLIQYSWCKATRTASDDVSVARSSP